MLIANNMASSTPMAKKRVRLHPFLRKLFSISAVIYIALTIVLFFFQRDLLYFPTAEIDHGYSTFSLSSDNETLEIIVLNEGNAKSLIYFGGNNETVAKHAKEHQTNFPNHTVYLLNYRGYGGSTGSPTEQGIYTDALALFDFVNKKHAYTSIMGRSLGTGVATYVAANRIIHKLILITPYDSIEEIAKSQYPIFPISLLIQDTFDSHGRAAMIKAPTLIVVAENDQLIPTENTLRLIRAFSPSILKVKAFKGAGHGNVSHLDEYHELLKDFVKERLNNRD